MTTTTTVAAAVVSTDTTGPPPVEDAEHRGPFDDQPVETVLERLESVSAMLGQRHGGHQARMHGARMVLTWLAGHPGDGWQSRWRAAGAESNPSWTAEVIADPNPRPYGRQQREVLAGARCLMLGRVVLPGYAFLAKLYGVTEDVRQARRPDLFARLEAAAAAQQLPAKKVNPALTLISKMVLHTGRDVDELTVEDVHEYCGDRPKHGAVWPAWHLLAIFGKIPDQPLRTSRREQRSTVELVEQYHIKDPTIRGVLIRYLNERRPSMDYASLRVLASQLVGAFWADIEQHHPGIDSIDLPPEVAEAWKQRMLTVTRGGVTRPRRNRLSVFMKVRAFYLDIAEWALEDPSWAPWAVPSPIRRGETTGYGKQRKKTTADMHQRVRERLPHLPTLVDAADRYLATATELLAAANSTPIGATFDHDGIAYRRLPYNRYQIKLASDRHALVEQVSTGEVSDLLREENDAFWAWAIIETLRHTGVRVEELLEITHLALVSYRLPDTGEIVPLLQILPSKSNEERLLLVSPELASALATIITRLRTAHGGAIPLVGRYDPHERVVGPPLPHLFQRSTRSALRADVISPTMVAQLLNQTLARTGLTDAAGAPLVYTPHDFRRCFATEAVTGGLPVHIVAKLLGHGNLATTQAYTAVFQDDLVRTYRAFLDQRRAVRPEAEYREPTNEEWREFHQHFELRKLELGTCGRPYGSPCRHEHACIRCPMLRVDPGQRPRLIAIIRNLGDRITEARMNGWLGEVEGLQVSLEAARGKLTALDRATSAPTTSVTNLGIPVIRGT